MRKRKRFSAILMGVAVVDLSAYVGYRTYDAYAERQIANDLLLENVESLASEDEGSAKNRWSGEIPCEKADGSYRVCN